MTVYVHGVTGDHFGTVPLAYERRHLERAVLFDLPGHGGTAMPGWCDRESFQRWFGLLLDELDGRGLVVSRVIGHSFGCSVALAAAGRVEDIVLITPPGPPTRLSRCYTWAMWVGGSFIRWLYNIRWIALVRGFFISREKWQRLAKSRRAWTVARYKLNTDRFVFYQRIAMALMDGKLITRPFGRTRVLMVVGLRDNLVKSKTSHMIASDLGASVKLIDGGHLLPIESPESVQAAIASFDANHVRGRGV